ncbi:MAG: hypothetical protein AVDCRST_MAG11-3835 [uncultured Gemmatimonadaceae bacterium]|uniref:Uncharacterized protein n=1 Tax=uncultured Gemmatimonadaceae bacterium TaxID=246130 RepID=A0A6J4MD26_9BACT|nr:MAG: hypothetical protein AVDCRST_MAG11-3835 [uncultured Gemmatimonadaceae bacterium]
MRPGRAAPVPLVAPRRVVSPVPAAPGVPGTVESVCTPVPVIPVLPAIPPAPDIESVAVPEVAAAAPAPAGAGPPDAPVSPPPWLPPPLQAPITSTVATAATIVVSSARMLPIVFIMSPRRRSAVTRIATATAPSFGIHPRPNAGQ